MVKIAILVYDIIICIRNLIPKGFLAFEHYLLTNILFIIPVGLVVSMYFVNSRLAGNEITIRN